MSHSRKMFPELITIAQNLRKPLAIPWGYFNTICDI